MMPIYNVIGNIPVVKNISNKIVIMEKYRKLICNQMKKMCDERVMRSKYI